MGGGASLYSLDLEIFFKKGRIHFLEDKLTCANISLRSSTNINYIHILTISIVTLKSMKNTPKSNTRR